MKRKLKTMKISGTDILISKEAIIKKINSLYDISSITIDSQTYKIIN
jgi:hypothetical protein